MNKHDQKNIIVVNFLKKGPRKMIFFHFQFFKEFLEVIVNGATEGWV
jgi:hypothetical protein